MSNSVEQEALWRAAQSLTRDAATLEVFRRVDARYVEMWRAGVTVEDREAAHARVRALEDVRSELSAIAAEPTVTAFNRRLRGTQ